MKKQPTTTYHLALLGIGGYHLVKTFLFSLFALYNPGINCRHSPTCSVYAKNTITHRGFVRGGYLTLKRLLSCHSFHFKKE